MSGKKKKNRSRTQQPSEKGLYRMQDNRVEKSSAQNAHRKAKRPPVKELPPVRNRTVPKTPLFDKNNVMEILARLFLLSMVFVFPLAMGEQKYGNITHFKNSVFYVLAALGLCSVIVAMIVKVISTPADRFRVDFPKLSIPDIAVLCYCGCLLISTLL